MEKYSTKENETYREHAEKAVHKAEEHGQKARHNLQENMQKLKDDAQETAIEAENEAKTGVRKEKSETSLFLPQYFGERPPPGTYAGMRMPESPETLRMKSGCAGSQTIICSG